MKETFTISQNDRVRFNNNADFCVGTGRMGLALSAEYLEQLKTVQDSIGFRHIRGHGLFSDDMAIYRKRKNPDGTETAEYCFTYLDRVMDSYLKLGIRPFLELGFMPKDMASGDQTVFYWKGNTTPPKKWDDFAELVYVTIMHLIERYGRDEVRTWPVEVWNEPNLPGFWKGADMENYFRLYRVSADAVKRADPEMKVGGPAICGVDDERWLRSFLEFVRDTKAPLDFVTRHHYTSTQPEFDGHYGYIMLHKPEEAFSALERSRTIVDSFPEFKDMDIHITEFNTSYIPVAPVHDTNLNAAYVAHMLSKLGDSFASYSYWTFGDVFEEMGVAFTPFSGGFGLVANGCIKKPTFYTFEFFSKLHGECIFRSDHAVIVKNEDGSFDGCAWNPDLSGKGESLDLSIALNGPDSGLYTLIRETVDEECCNPLKLWHDAGEPASPSAELTELLRNAARPLIRSELLGNENNSVLLDLTLKKNAVEYFSLRPVTLTPDTGYSYERTMKTKAERC